MRIGLIVPTYGAFGYARRAIESFFAFTPGNDNKCFMIDDASPTWQKTDFAKWPPHVITTCKDTLSNSKATSNILMHRFYHNKGITRSWNLGLTLGKSEEWKCDYLICGNSDILFTPQWSEPLVKALEHEDLVGPTTNAAGRVKEQVIQRFYPDYKLTDDKERLAETAEYLRNKWKDRYFRNWRINGFFMMAKTETWWRHAYNDKHVFCPTDNMVNVAYNLQARLRKRKGHISVVPASFIFHYRSISRGNVGLMNGCGRGAWRRK